MWRRKERRWWRKRETLCQFCQLIFILAGFLFTKCFLSHVEKVSKKQNKQETERKNEDLPGSSTQRDNYLQRRIGWLFLVRLYKKLSLISVKFENSKKMRPCSSHLIFILKNPLPLSRQHDCSDTFIDSDESVNSCRGLRSWCRWWKSRFYTELAPTTPISSDYNPTVEEWCRPFRTSAAEAGGDGILQRHQAWRRDARVTHGKFIWMIRTRGNLESELRRSLDEGVNSFMAVARCCGTETFEMNFAGNM